MDRFQKGWFTELSTLWPGQALSIEAEEVLYEGKSKFQDVVVFRSKSYGIVLALDGAIQCTEADEFTYQEMMAHVPLCSHPNPKKVLVVGGGDGGVLREIARHACVEEVTLCEIDEEVIRIAQKYLPHMSVGFKDPRVKIHIGDGFEFLRGKEDVYDVIITDSSDPVGPAESLYEEEYYHLLHKALRPGGVVATQAENMFLHTSLIRKFFKGVCASIFEKAAYASIFVPTYPSGQLGMMVCRKRGDVGGSDTDLSHPVRRMDPEALAACRYYSEEVHRAAFVLPIFARKGIYE